MNLPRKSIKPELWFRTIEQTGKVNHYTLTTILKTLNISLAEFETFDEKKVLKNTSVPYAVNEEIKVLQDN